MPELEVQEHRKSARCELDLRVHVQDMGGKESVLLSHDWGENSVFLRTHNPLPIGSLVAGYVVIPDPPTRAEIRGVVVRAVKPGDLSHHRPPGMALRLTFCPDILRQHVVRASRNQAILNTPIVGTVVPVVMVVGGDRLARASVAHLLEAANFEVVEAEHCDGALGLVDHGILPDVVFALGDESVDLMLRQLENVSHEKLPQLVVYQGAPPKFGRTLPYPLIVLPPSASVQQVPSLLRQLVHTQQATFEVEAAESLEPQPVAEPIANP
jgi:hypothetical protein